MTYIINAYLKTGAKVYIKHPVSLNYSFARTRAKTLIEKKRNCICEIVAQSNKQAEVIWSSEQVTLN